MKKVCIRCKGPLMEPMYYGLHEECFLKWFNLSTPQEFYNLDSKKQEGSSGQWKIKQKKDTFYHGRYLKYSAHLNNLNYILKVQEEKYPDLPGMEYLCNCIASLLSLEVPKYYLITFNKRLTFVTYNFMQDYQKSTLHHIYKFIPSGEENHNCEQLIDVIQKQTGRLIDVIRFIKICLFDALIGNNDRHGRNLGVIETQGGKKLAPMYDNPSYFGIEVDSILGADLNPSCSIWTSSSKEPKFLDYMVEFKRLDFEKACLQFKKEFLNQFELIKKEVDTAFISRKRKKALLNFLHKKVKDCEKC